MDVGFDNCIYSHAGVGEEGESQGLHLLYNAVVADSHTEI